MTQVPLISICIPTFKRTEYLKRLLDTLAIQTFRDFEAIITDDSNDASVEKLAGSYGSRFNLIYRKNPQVLGTPENWNNSMRLASGKWIKLMHDDDWFTDADSLAEFVRAISENPDASFLFSAYRNVYFEKKDEQDVKLTAVKYKRIRSNPVNLFSSNVIGPPSVVIHKNDKVHYYDKTLKWLVDIDFYIRYLRGNKPVYIDRVLVNVGIGSEQVTQDCFRLRQIEIPEAFVVLNKIGAGQLKHILVYDAWWRLMRNVEVRKKEDIPESGYTGKIPVAILSMIRWQSKISLGVLKIGVISKSLMFLNYLFNRSRIKD